MVHPVQRRFTVNYGTAAAPRETPLTISGFTTT